MGAAFLKFLTRRIVRTGSLTIVLPDGASFAAGDGSGAPVEMRLTDRAAVRRLALTPDLALGELYAEGKLQLLQGSIVDLCFLMLSNVRRAGFGPIIGPWQRVRLLKRRLFGHTPAARARHNVARHYDLDGGLYDLFLDSDKQYSCAYFDDPRATLEEAQRAKVRHIAKKLLLAPGQRVLDIGSGWGGLALALAREWDVRVLGVTLSGRQLKIARERAKREGLSDRVEFRLADYRDLRERFDRIVSVGMFEHVGRGDYRAYFAAIHRMLKSQGVALIHAIGSTRPPIPTARWIDKYIFPGAVVGSLSEVLPHVERQRMFVGDLEIWRLHYAETLRHWRMRFAENRAAAVALYDERFARMWEFYLASCEASFRVGNIVVFQLQLLNALNAAPLTRDYMYEESAGSPRKFARDRIAAQGAYPAFRELSPLIPPQAPKRAG